MIDRLANKLSFRLAVFAALAAVLVWTLLPYAPFINEFRDVHHLFFYERTAIDTIRRYHELPLWNPYYCGGFDAVGAPQTRFVSPSLVLGLAFGAERAEILTVFFFTILGMEGAYRWLRLRAPYAGACLMVAPVFALSGQFAVAYYRGWIQFLAFHLVPWVLYGVTLAARRRIAGVAIASIAFAWMLGFAGFFAAPMLGIACLVEALRALWEEHPPNRARSFAMLAATALFMGAVAWVRLWPVAETLAAAPRIMAGTPGHLPRALLNALVGNLEVKDGNTELMGSFYVGSAFIAMVALGAQDRKAFRALLLVLVFLWLAQGYQRQPSLFAMMRQIPVFSSLRYPERFLWIATLFASETAANALGHTPLVGEGKNWRRLAWLVLGGSLVWTIGHELSVFERVATSRIMGQVSPLEPPLPFRQSRGNRWATVHVQATGLGSLSCYETHRMAMSPLLRADLPAEEYLAAGAENAGTVARTSWSPNRIGLHVELTRPARVLVNQNWAPGWHSSIGTTTTNDGLIAVDLPAGSHDVTLSFRPWSTVGGFLVTSTALLALAILLVRERRRGDVLSRDRRWSTAALVVAPWIVAGAAYAASPDPHPTRHAPTNPNRSPALVDRVEGTPLGVQLALPLRVEAGHVLPQDENDVVTFEVYLKRTGPIPRSTAMYVHVVRKNDQEPPEKDKEAFYNADHQVVGGTFFLSDLPEGRLVRDAFGLHLTDKTAKGTWQVLVGFGHVTGTGRRSRVVDRGTAPATDVVDDMIVIGTFDVR